MTLFDSILLFAAALAAGVLNSVAGGGSFFSFPALIFSGVPAIHANATNTVAIWPGTVASATAYRKRVPRNAIILVPLILASLAGGFFGAHLLIHTPQRTFLRLIPFLFLGATFLFAFGKKLVRGSARPDQRSHPSWLALGGVTLVQFFIAVYGGYFGGGMGILILSLLAFLPLPDIHATNGIKALLTSAANGAAIVTFISARLIFWPQAVLMLVGAALGGYGGAHFAQKFNPSRVRALVICVGFTMSFYFLYRYH